MRNSLILDDFFTRLLSNFNFERDGALLEAITSAAHQSHYALPIRKVLGVYRLELEKAEKALEEVPIQGSGKWFTPDQIVNLGLGYDLQTIQSILDENKSQFPSQVSSRRFTDQVGVWYWISADNLTLLDNEKALKGQNKKTEFTKSETWTQKLTFCEDMRVETSRLEEMINEIEAKNAPLRESIVEESSGVESQDNKVRNSEGIRMELSQVRSIGSTKDYASLTKMIKDRTDDFCARKEGVKWSILVTPENYMQLGLPIYPGPPEHLKKKNGKNEGLQETPLEDEVWLTIKEIQKANSPYGKMTLGAIIREKKEVFFSRPSGEGHSLEVRVTPTNAKLLGIAFPGFDTNIPFASASSIKIQRGAREVTYLAEVRYTPETVMSLLKEINPEAFTPTAIGKALQAMEADQYISGDNLVLFLRRTRDMRTLASTSTQKMLGSMFGVERFSEIENYTQNPLFKRFFHTYPEVFDSSYVLKSELEALQSTINQWRSSQPKKNPVRNNGSPDRVILHSRQQLDPSVIYTGNDVEEALRQYDSHLAKNGILPPPPIYSLLISKGIFDQSSLKAVQDSYGKFIDEMEGWEFLNINGIRSRRGIDWPAFRRDYLMGLEEKMLVKDLARSFEAQPGFYFYVVAQGKRRDVLKVISPEGT